MPQGRISKQQRRTTPFHDLYHWCHMPQSRKELKETIAQQQRQLMDMVGIMDAFAELSNSTHPTESHESIPLQALWAIRRGLISHARTWPATRAAILGCIQATNETLDVTEKWPW